MILSNLIMKLPIMMNMTILANPVSFLNIKVNILNILVTILTILMTISDNPDYLGIQPYYHDNTDNPGS